MHPRDAILLMRPRQWTKNLAVFAGLIFAEKLFETPFLARVLLAFVALDLLSSGLYAINDAQDAERDRHHPLKRERPVAAGRVTRTRALAFGVALLATGLALSVSLGWPFLACVVGYLALQSGYALLLKHVSIVDMLVIAAGFVIRAIAGAVVISVPVSPWLVLCTGLLALFLAAAKRRHEILLLGDRSADHRPVLASYTPELLDSFMVTLSSATITSYALYTFYEPHAPGHLMMVTIPFVVYGVLHYQYLVGSKEAGGRPEEVLLTDKPTLVCIGLWIVSAVLVLYLVPVLAR